MMRKVIIVVLILASLSCWPLHFYCLPDTNGLTFYNQTYGNREKIVIGLASWHLWFQSDSYLNPSTTPLEIDINFVQYRRNLISIKQAQMWRRSLSIPLIVCMLILGLYPIVTFIYGPLRRYHPRHNMVGNAVAGSLVGGTIGFIGCVVASQTFLYILFPLFMLLSIVFGLEAIMNNHYLVIIGGSAFLGSCIGAVITLGQHKPKPGYCQKCGYNLTGNESGVCPECGTVIKL